VQALSFSHDVVIGQYLPGTSWLHRADARLKLVGTLIVGLTAALAQNAQCPRARVAGLFPGPSARAYRSSI